MYVSNSVVVATATRKATTAGVTETPVMGVDKGKCHLWVMVEWLVLG